jgi:hypothetical protein
MLESLLLQRSASILARWFDAVLETYPPDAKRFLKKQKNGFANPVGTTLSKEMEALYRELLQGAQEERVSPILDRIVRIRAVQDFSPSQALSFVFSLKGIIRSETEKVVSEKGLERELLEMESRIDALALLSFDIYMACKDRIFEIRLKEASSHVTGLLRKAGLISELPDRGAGRDPDLGHASSTS